MSPRRWPAWPRGGGWSPSRARALPPTARRAAKRWRACRSAGGWCSRRRSTVAPTLAPAPRRIRGSPSSIASRPTIRAGCLAATASPRTSLSCWPWSNATFPRAHRHVHLSRPTLIRTRAQPVPDHALEPAHGGLGPGARVVARGLLPAHPALLGDELQVAVPRRRRGLGRGAGHGGRARRNDDVRARVALGHVGVNALLVVRAVRREGGDRVRDLVQQGADLGGVVFVAVGQGGGHDPAGLGVHAEMEL